MSAASEIRAVADAARRFPRDWTRDGSRLVSEAITLQSKADTGGDGRLSNARGYGAVTVDVRLDESQASITNGGDKTIWAWLEDGTGRHRVRARRQGGTLRTPYGPRQSVVVEGMKAKQTWTKGNEKGLDAAERDALARFERGT